MNVSPQTKTPPNQKQPMSGFGGTYTNDEEQKFSLKSLDNEEN
jgi:hypothetical protein